MFQVADVGNVAYITHFVAQVAQVAEDEVKGDGRTGVAQVGVTVDGGPADIHAHVRSMQGNELLLLAGQCIVDVKFLFHSVIILWYDCVGQR